MRRRSLPATLATNPARPVLAQGAGPARPVRIAEHEDGVALLHGHYESRDIGGGDTASGDACLPEVGRILHADRAILRRGLNHALAAIEVAGLSVPTP